MGKVNHLVRLLQGFVLWVVSFVVSTIVGLFFGASALIMSGNFTIGLLFGILGASYALGWAHQTGLPRKIFK